MASKRKVLRQLKRDELQEAANFYELDVFDRRVTEDLVESIASSKRARLADILGGYTRNRLKEICEALDLPSMGREKDLLVARITGKETTGTNGVGQSAASLLLEMLGDRISVVDARRSWPVDCELVLRDSRFNAAIYARTIGPSSRGNPQERRFQNPSSTSEITAPDQTYALLFGLWTEQGEDRSVIVGFDAYRRVGRRTRFSLFMPLSLLEEGADTGFAVHLNAKRERLVAFRPENLARYWDDFLAQGLWETYASEQTSSVVEVRPKQETLTPSRQDTIFIRPRVGMYSAFARLNYKAWFALAEFIDNSIQSYLNVRDEIDDGETPSPLLVDIDLDDDELQITDRAGGIAWADFPRAFSPAAPPADASGLSEFGLGLKAAACWFSKEWSVRTSALGESVEREVNFDVPKIASEGMDSLPIESRRARESDHFTVVTLKSLRVRPQGRTIGKIKDHLSSIYRVLMADGIVKIRFTSSGNTTDLMFEHPELLTAPYYRTPSGPPIYWKKDLEIEINGKRVTGWAGILKDGRYADAGFSVFRRRRLIMGSVDDAYRPPAIFGSPNSFASQRVTGELFLEGFDVTHTKDGIQWQGDEDAIIDAIRSQLTADELPILNQAAGHRARKEAKALPPGFGAKALSETSNALVRPETSTILGNQVEKTASEEEELAEEATGSGQLLHEKTLRLQVGEVPWDVRIELVSEAGREWYETSRTVRDGSESIAIRINLNHPFSVAFINNDDKVLPPLMRLVTALALGEHTARQQGVSSAGAVRRNANRLLRTVLSEEQD